MHVRIDDRWALRHVTKVRPTMSLRIFASALHRDRRILSYQAISPQLQPEIRMDSALIVRDVLLDVIGANRTGNRANDRRVRLGKL
jgi:hypothetical protein